MDLITLLIIILLVLVLTGGAWSVHAGSAPGGLVALVIVLVLVFLLAGCAVGEQLVDQVVPTARYCHEVHYDRIGDAVELTASCTAPFGGI
jgi:hypothetical protein